MKRKLKEGQINHCELCEKSQRSLREQLPLFHAKNANIKRRKAR